MRAHRRHLLRALTAVAALPAATARAQSAAWPAKPLRLVVGYPPGGSGDFITRVAADELARVTERFYRADKSGAIPGTGLGMAIVKEIVELMGGSLQLASEPQRGTRVTVRLPTMQAP
jgi:hypothetical protein